MVGHSEALVPLRERVAVVDGAVVGAGSVLSEVVVVVVVAVEKGVDAFNGGGAGGCGDGYRVMFAKWRWCCCVCRGLGGSVEGLS